MRHSRREAPDRRARARARGTEPDALQARYDAARDREERAPAERRPRRRARARTEVLAAERYDNRPARWRGDRHSPGFAVPPVARAERPKDAALAAQLAALGASYRGWSAFWVHDLDRNVGRLELRRALPGGVDGEARRTRRSAASRSPPRLALWYDLRQLAGWSSNLAANRLTRRLGGEPVVERALHRLGARERARIPARTAPGRQSPPTRRSRRRTALARHDRA